jgi:hypothetical protein
MRKSDRKNGEEARVIRCLLETDYSLAPTIAPLLGQGGEAGATGHGGGGSNGRKKAKSVAGSQRLALPQWRCATAVAARHIPLAEERSFPAIFPFATETGLRLVTLVVKQQLQGKEEVESHWWFRVKAWS